MKESDFEVFAEALLEVAKRFHYSLSEDDVVAYWHDLKGYPAQSVLLALRTAVNKLKFFPKISEIISLIEGSDEQKAERAWLELLKAAREYGAYASIYLDAKTAWVLERLWGGWDKFCAELRSDNKTFLHSQFIKAYNSAPDIKGVTKMRGLIEGNNNANGYALEGADCTPVAFILVSKEEAIEAEKRLQLENKNQTKPNAFTKLSDIINSISKQKSIGAASV